MYFTNKVPCSQLKRLILFVLVSTLLLLGTNAYALSSVTATVEKNPAMLNESILLTVVADDNVDRNALDTSPLLSDFIVGQTSVSSQTSIINFKTSRTTKWQIILIARYAGKLTIPALSIDNKQSDPIQITVVEASSANTNAQADIFITSELSTKQVYVQQLLTLSLKLHFSVELKGGNLTEPSLTGASIEKIGQNKQSDSIINGKRYRVIEQTYAITPEQSGEFTLTAPLFSGEVLQASNSRSSFFNLAQTKPVSILGNELEISVLPIPENYPANAQWLPTDILTLHQEWQSTGGKFIVGEPITRTITLIAAGLSKAQLPQLEMTSSHGLKIYPDQAELHSNLSKDRLVSQKTQNFALVPSVAGDFVLPAMSITWFNTITNKIEQATLPSQTISVQAAEDNPATNNSSQPMPLASEVNKANIELTNQAQPTSIQNRSPQDQSFQWLFLTLWLLTSIAWFVHVIYLKRAGSNVKAVATSHIPSSGNHYLALLDACKSNNAEQALSLVLPWLKQLLADEHSVLAINNIAQATAIVKDQNFATALNDLQQHLYGKSAINGAPSWQGMTLFNAIEIVQKQQGEKARASQVLPLNP